MPNRLERLNAVRHDLQHGQKRHGQQGAKHTPEHVPEEERGDHEHRVEGRPARAAYRTMIDVLMISKSDFLSTRQVIRSSGEL